MAHITGPLTMATAKGPTYTLDSLENHAVNVRTNTLDINASLSKILVLLRGEALTGQGLGETSPACGKLAEISIVLQGARSNQDETFRLIAELQSLLNVDA